MHDFFGLIFRKLKEIPPWILLTMLVLSAITCILALRSNNHTMLELRNAVYAADENNGDVPGALNDLRAYVYAHMNTDLSTGNAIKPPIQLKHTHERLQAVEQRRVDVVNEKLYTAAQRYCEAQNPTSFFGRDRVGCIQRYILDHDGAQPKQIPPALYQFDFVSPSWSPDLAGWSMVASAIFLIAFVVRLAYEKLAVKKPGRK